MSETRAWICGWMSEWVGGSVGECVSGLVVGWVTKCVGDWLNELVSDQVHHFWAPKLIFGFYKQQEVPWLRKRLSSQGETSMALDIFYPVYVHDICWLLWPSSATHFNFNGQLENYVTKVKFTSRTYILHSRAAEMTEVTNRGTKNTWKFLISDVGLQMPLPWTLIQTVNVYLDTDNSRFLSLFTLTIS